ncbi:MAG: 16S rRNA (adenine(1518)-N(6)/adenine(1519)-N(6))-dimethyltransferase RsmA [Desulfovibrio sp.]|nr:16S rRNA (adenine(1518)-N(6)/adenine(1519)-N(6))-dimethyltransferase RsmA [Desulfovibrio sp.]
MTHNSTVPEKYFPKAKKSLGQHFLIRDDICKHIAALLLPQKNDRLIEIGPGPGALTRALEAQPHECLLLLEKDNYWAEVRQRSARLHTQTVLMDAMCFDWRRIQQGSPWKITGNLPYNIASPLIWDSLSLSAGWQRAVFMVQKEVGQRLAASPGSKKYGALSVWVQSFAKPQVEFIVRPGAFNPPPKVDSAVLSFTPLPVDKRPHFPAVLAKLLRVCFQQRRKQLGGIFKRSNMPGLVEALNHTRIDKDLRPEALTVMDFQRLALTWASMSKPISTIHPA